MKKTKIKLIAGVMLVFMLMQAFTLSAWAGTGRYYKNGSTKEYVYSTVASCNAQGSDYIGYMSPYSTGTVWGYYAGLYIVGYNTDSGDTKIGFVKYNGGNTNPHWQPIPFKNGPSRAPVYSSWNNAKAGVNSIGSLDPNEGCTNLGYFGAESDQLFSIVLYSTGYTAKVGLVRGAGV